MEVGTRKKLADEIKWMKASGVSWQGDGFYYSRYPEPAKGKELSSKNEFQTVYFHKVGTPQSADVLVYEDKQNPQRFHNVGTTEDERFRTPLDLRTRQRQEGKCALLQRSVEGRNEVFSDRRGDW